jgi:23S rRNA pseudouridine1911/1915/1917 synthase
MEDENINFTVSNEDVGQRIDTFISEKIEDMSRSHVQKLIGENNVFVNNKEARSNYKIRIGDIIKVVIPEPVKLNLVAEDIAIEILYEDEDIVVVNKPQGMVVHPAAGNYTGTLVNALLGKCNLSGINGVIRPGIVHRIDKDTSGILVVAKNDVSHNNLAEQIKNHSVTRVYVALVEGIIKDDEGAINAPIGRHPIERKRMAVVSRNGRNAITHYRVLERYRENTLIEARLETGRTHQIRVHMAYIGHPLVGDPVYGYKKQKYKLKGQALHAKTLGFIHPTKCEYMEFTAPMPEYFQNLLNKLK